MIEKIFCCATAGEWISSNSKCRFCMCLINSVLLPTYDGLIEHFLLMRDLLSWKITIPFLMKHSAHRVKLWWKHDFEHIPLYTYYRENHSSVYLKHTRGCLSWETVFLWSVVNIGSTAVQVWNRLLFSVTDNCPFLPLHHQKPVDSIMSLSLG